MRGNVDVCKGNEHHSFSIISGHTQRQESKWNEGKQVCHVTWLAALFSGVGVEV